MENKEICASNIEIRGDTLPFKIAVERSIFSEFFGEQSVAKVKDGFLVGFNGGEWGGSLYWFSADGTRNYRISRNIIIQFIKREKKLYAIEGLAHMGADYGSIIEIKNAHGKWTSKEYISLPLQPAVIALYKANNFIVITSSSLLEINADRTINTLIENGFWKLYLSPASAITDVKNHSVYFGMSGGVFKYNFMTKVQEWLMPN